MYERMIWIVGFLCLYLLGLFGIAWMSLHPLRIPVYLSPDSLGVKYQEVKLELDGVIVRGWWLEAPGSMSVMVCFHGYMMNRCELTPEACHLWKQGISCLLLDFPGHGKSGNKKCTLGVKEKSIVVAGVREARRLAPGAKIGLLGSSMGSAACAFALGDDPKLADLLILDSCYGRLNRAINGWWNFIGGRWLALLLSPCVVLCAPMVGFNPFQVNVGDSLAKLEGVPVLILHGDQDRLAIPSEAQANFDAAHDPKELVWFQGCNHSEGRWEQASKYREVLFVFLRRHGFLGSINK